MTGDGSALAGVVDEIDDHHCDNKGSGAAGEYFQCLARFIFVSRT